MTLKNHDNVPQAKVELPLEQAILPPQLSLPFHFVESKSFLNFVTHNNEEIISSLKGAILGRGEWFIYLHGMAGTGKSHLLQAACRLAGDNGIASTYLPFSMIQHFSPDLLEGLENLSFVALDDIDLIAGDSVWEEAVFHLFNRIRDRRNALVVTASAPPKEIGVQLPDLVSRLGWGVTYGLHDLNDEDKLTILLDRAHQRGLDLPSDIGHYLLTHYARDLPTLIDILNHLDSLSLSSRQKITKHFIRETLTVAKMQ